MKLYLVSGCTYAYDENDIYGVYDSLDKAKEEVKKLIEFNIKDGFSSSGAGIEEIELNTLYHWYNENSEEKQNLFSLSIEDLKKSQS